MSNLNEERVLSVHHWNDSLFSFKTTRNQGRINDLLDSGKLMGDLGLPALDPEHDRVMICGSPSMLKDIVTILEARGFDEGNTDRQGSYVIERAFVS